MNGQHCVATQLPASLTDGPYKFEMAVIDINNTPASATVSLSATSTGGKFYSRTA